MTEKNIRLIIISVLILGIATLLTLPKEKVVAPEELSPAESIRVGFMEGCVDGDPTMSEYCSCSYDSIVADVGVNGLVEFGLTYDETGELPQGMLEALVDCIHLIK